MYVGWVTRATEQDSIGPLVLRHAPASSTKFLLLDRDGVLIENRSTYITESAHVQFIPGAADAARAANERGWSIAVVTNQSAIGRGILDEQDALRIHHEVIDELADQGVIVSLSAICPHAPNDGCPCRKPRAGLVHAIEQAVVLDRSESWLVGDALTDMACAGAALVQHVMVETGRGLAQLALLGRPPGFPVTSNLANAIALIEGT